MTKITINLATEGDELKITASTEIAKNDISKKRNSTIIKNKSSHYD
ncbi:MAG: hypothetical protein ABI763_16310 [Bacteroidota bacterium]